MTDLLGVIDMNNVIYLDERRRQQPAGRSLDRRKLTAAERIARLNRAWGLEWPPTLDDVEDNAAAERLRELLAVPPGDWPLRYARRVLRALDDMDTVARNRTYRRKRRS